MRTQLSFSVYFTLRADKEKAGCAPLYVAITVNKEKRMVALKKQVDLNLWDTGRGLARGRSEEAKSLNTYLNEVRTVITNIHNDLQLKGNAISANAIKSLFLGEEQHSCTLSKLMAYYNEVSRNVLTRGPLKVGVNIAFVLRFLNPCLVHYFP